MLYKEVKGDLFSLPNDTMLVHCISADYALGAGIAKIFRDKYNVKDLLIKQGSRYIWTGNGCCRIVSAQNQDGTGFIVANLVTKCRYFNKPTYETMKQALLDLKQQLKTDYPEIKRLGMPLIGCGLDKLNWNEVSLIIKQLFDETDYEITVCCL